MELQISPFLFLILFVFSLPLSSLQQQDLAGDRAALLSLRSAVGGRTLLWNATEPTPCHWTGVKCNDDRVIALHLPGFGLTGEISEGVFGNLTRLRTVSLRLNSLTGSIPSDLARCSNLRNLYLQGNKFSGEIPEFIFGLTGLVRLNLAGNNFSGGISPGFNNLTRLKTLYLEENRLSGSLPDLDLQLDQFNVSNNQLNGSIPKNLQQLGSDSFLGNSLCGKPLDICPNQGTVPSKPTLGNNGPKNREEKKKKDNNKLSGGAIAGIVIGSVVGFALILLILIVLCRKKGDERSRAIDIASANHQEPEVKPIGDDINGNSANGYSVAAAAAAAMTGNAKSGEINGSGANKLVFFGNAGRVFDLEDLLRASAEVLGKGAFGTAYKAVLDAATAVVVKRLKDVAVSEAEFREKIERIGGLVHENLVPLRAYYYSRDEKLLVLDYMPLGSLSALLHGNNGAGRTPLNWEARSRIAVGAARAIDYIHTQSSEISHGNIKSSNVLLTKSHDARVSDFCLSQLISPSSSNPNRATGYRAPEVTDPGEISQKADVYSFGVLLLELITGKAPMNSVLNEEGIDLPRWIRSIMKEEWSDKVFDPEMMRYENVEDLEIVMVRLLEVGIDCTDQNPDNRPSISEVVGRIEDLRRESRGISQPDRVDVAEDDVSALSW